MLNSKRWLQIAQDADMEWKERVETVSVEAYSEDPLCCMLDKEADMANSLAMQWERIENDSQG